MWPKNVILFNMVFKKFTLTFKKFGSDTRQIQKIGVIVPIKSVKKGYRRNRKEQSKK